MSASPPARPARWALWLLVSALLVLVPAGMARAHSDLVSSNPADGSAVGVMPNTATLTFNEEISPSFAEVVVAGADGQARKADALTRGATVTAVLPAGLGAGRVEVRYRVVSRDGHPITGQIAFTAATAAPTSPAGTTPTLPTSGSTSSAAPTSGTPAAAATPTGPGTASGSTAPSSQGTDSGVSGAVYGLIALVTAALALVGAGLLLLRRRGRRTAR